MSQTVLKKSSSNAMPPEVTVKVTVAMGVRNEVATLRKSIESILSQSFQDFEFLIYDNASSDGTDKICEEFANRDPRIVYHRYETNQGATFSFNEMCHAAQGEYILFAAGHDRWHPDFLKECLKPFAEDPYVVLSYPVTVWVDNKGDEVGVDTRLFDIRPINHRGFHPLLQFNSILWDFNHSHAVYGLIAMKALKRTRPFRQTIAPDTLFLSELSLIGSFAQVPKPLYYSRVPQVSEENDLLKRHLSNIQKPKEKKRKRFPYVAFALQYFLIPFHKPLELTFSLKLGILFSLMMRFIVEFFRRPFRLFRTVSH